MKDQVNRHYFSMFAAVGAVGILSGLTSAGGIPTKAVLPDFEQVQARDSAKPPHGFSTVS